MQGDSQTNGKGKRVNNIDFSKIEVKKLSKIYDTSSFDCKDSDINEFLRNDALLWQNKKLATTHVFIYNEEVIGFFCSSADSIKLKGDEKKREDSLNKKRVREIPAIKIGRLARSVKYNKQKLGEWILKWAIGDILKLNEKTGVRFVTIDAYPEKVSWYEQFGFKKNLHEDYQNKNNVSMRYCLHNPPKNE